MHYTQTKGILLPNNYMNIYRGCTHGCIYCDVRSECYNFKHDIEDVEVKTNAPVLLEQALSKKRKKCVIKTGYMTDSYMPYEEKLRLTRECLEIIYKYDFAVAIQTKSNLVLRDLDLLKAINAKNRSVVQMSVTTNDDKLCKYIEPSVCTTSERFEALKILNEHNIPTVAWLTPILPFINDTRENITGLLENCHKVGVKGIIYGKGVTLRAGSRGYFYKNLDKYFPGIRSKYEQRYGNSHECVSRHEPYITELVETFCSQNKVLLNDATFAYMFEYAPHEKSEQLSWF